MLGTRAAPRVAALLAGGGAIALALRHERPDAQVLAVDASAGALAVARANAERLGLPVRFVQADWLAGLAGPFDAIVRNPPYIPAQDPHLAALAHEPHRIAFYLYDLASEFHALWTKGRDLPHLRFIIQNDAEITNARLALVQGVVSVLASGLAVLGVHAPDEMR